MSKSDLAVFIGRFQPFHVGHLAAVKRALEHADHLCIVVGSDAQPTTPKNPWTGDQRAEMIHAALTDEFDQSVIDRIAIGGVSDDPEPEWLANVQTMVANAADRAGFTSPDRRIAIVGHEKDESTYYLHSFPQWKTIELGYAADQPTQRVLDATQIRDLIFGHNFAYLPAVLPPAVHRYVMDWTQGPDFVRLKGEYEAIQAYRRSWAAAPFPPTFITVDAVVVQSGHVLVIERKNAPGKGQFAMPGGFININERIRDATWRELDEETSIALQRDVLDRCIVTTDVFDDPNRSQRGRTVTHVTLFHLNDTKPLPDVTPGDDAEDAFWMPLNEFRESRESFFEDHYRIITAMLRKLPAVS